MGAASSESPNMFIVTLPCYEQGFLPIWMTWPLFYCVRPLHYVPRKVLRRQTNKPYKLFYLPLVATIGSHFELLGCYITKIMMFLI